MTATNSERAGNGNAWIVALVILCLGMLGYGIRYSTNTVWSPAFLAGKYLAYALLVWGIFHVAFLRKRGSKISLIAFTAIYIALFAGGLISVQKQKQEAVQAISSIQEEMSRLATATTAPSGLLTRIERSAPQPSIARGEFGEMERFMKEYIDRIVAQRNDYLLELEAIGWNSILDATRIKNDTALSESRVMIERAKVIVDKYEKKSSELLQETRANIESLNVSEITKKGMLAGFESGIKKSKKQIDGQWSLEKQIAQQFENVFVMLATNKKWVVEGDRILFYSDSDLARFNTYIQAIENLIRQQEQIQKSSYAEINKNMESLKNSAQK